MEKAWEGASLLIADEGVALGQPLRVVDDTMARRVNTNPMRAEEPKRDQLERTNLRCHSLPTYEEGGEWNQPSSRDDNRSVVGRAEHDRLRSVALGWRLAA